MFQDINLGGPLPANDGPFPRGPTTGRFRPPPVRAPNTSNITSIQTPGHFGTPPVGTHNNMTFVPTPGHFRPQVRAPTTSNLFMAPSFMPAPTGQFRPPRVKPIADPNSKQGPHGANNP